MHPEQDLLLYLLRHLECEAMLRGGVFVPPSGMELSCCRGPQPALFLLLPNISFLCKHFGRRSQWERRELSSPCRGSRSALYVLPAVQACWDSHFSFSGDSFEQINGESFFSPWEIKKYHLMSHALQWEESKWRIGCYL